MDALLASCDDRNSAVQRAARVARALPWFVTMTISTPSLETLDIDLLADVAGGRRFVHAPGSDAGGFAPFGANPGIIYRAPRVPESVLRARMESQRELLRSGYRGPSAWTLMSLGASAY